MDYHEAANFLFDLRRFQVKPGTESVRELLAHLGDPHEDVDFVQIAGSNGKGSTAKMVESILREAGLQTGLYTSPHFDDVRERIRVDGRKIPEQALVEFVEEAKPYLVEQAADGEPLTFFEVVTAMGIWQFGRADVDVGVLEVGMGGKLDATSVVDPVASAVTNVSLEHTSVLGDTVEEIAVKKAAVAPADAPLVTAATGEALEVIRREAGDVVTVGDADAAADVTAVSRGPVNHTESTVAVDGPDWHVESRLPLLGAYQALNAGVACTLARQVADIVGDGGDGGDVGDADAAAVDEATLARGLRNAHWPGRFEVMEREPMVVLDGAHNPDACGQLATTLAAFDDEYADLHLVFAAMHDKDHRAMVDALPDVDSVITCKPNLSRAEDPEVLARVFEDAGVADVHAGFSVAGSLAKIRERAGADDCILVTGSLFCVAEARTTWTRLEVPKRVRDLDDAEAMLDGAHVTSPGVWRMRGKAVHRSLKLRVERRQAQYLKEEMLSLGGECATSGHMTDGELSSVVLMGTFAQFNRLIDKLAGQPFGLEALADDIRERLGIRVEQVSKGYPWEDGTAVMGILNVTPDSFHDGGDFFDATDAIEQAEAMIDAGVDIIDIGGESTRPGADEVSVEDEIDRVVPVIEAVSDLDVAISIDTRKAAVGRAALDAGADILNDVTGLADPEMRFLAAERDVPVIVMHSIDAPVIPDKEVEYDDVVEDVVDELSERVLLAEKAGIPRENVIVDPGLGFGKSKAENFELLGRLDEFDALGCPVLVGHSHKSMFELVGAETGDNLEATVAATAVAVDRGADIVRVHDVAENVAAVRVAQAARSPEQFSEK
ncbi:dihydropteroate synthase [Halogranum gelatinilyticum]|uniref:Probable bifunctional folylpolyglutamate synthase/dihydropteroate synthase n=1 Tax=Halogranum gelatinilyticum TaxID=660521 RepID=A0A1G9QWX7_9EURY|nr:dihydropteroate synthase [Halogranum gelatinilyticum]SDM15519.1 dihydropteroate synthase [Halogranum gelatinilyticum]